MRWTKNVSVWPVALTGGARWAGPVVSDGKVVRFHTNWAKDRKFPIDMAAFAVNLNVLIKKYPNAKFDDSVKRGYLEPTFLSTITTVDQLEPLADNCTKVGVCCGSLRQSLEHLYGGIRPQDWQGLYVILSSSIYTVCYRYRGALSLFIFVNMYHWSTQ